MEQGQRCTARSLFPPPATIKRKRKYYTSNRASFTCHKWFSLQEMVTVSGWLSADLRALSQNISSCFLVVLLQPWWYFLYLQLHRGLFRVEWCKFHNEWVWGSACLLWPHRLIWGEFTLQCNYAGPIGSWFKRATCLQLSMSAIQYLIKKCIKWLTTLTPVFLNLDTNFNEATILKWSQQTETPQPVLSWWWITLTTPHTNCF